MSTEDLEQLEEGIGRVLRKGARRAAAGGRRAWNKGRTLSPGQWNEALHPRDRRGRFIDVPGKILRLRNGQFYDLKEIVSSYNAGLASPEAGAPGDRVGPPPVEIGRDPSKIVARTKVEQRLSTISGVKGAWVHKIGDGPDSYYEVTVAMNDGNVHHERVNMREILMGDDPAEDLLDAIRAVIERTNPDADPHAEFADVRPDLKPCGCGCGGLAPKAVGFIQGHELREKVKGPSLVQRGQDTVQNIKNWWGRKGILPPQDPSKLKPKPSRPKPKMQRRGSRNVFDKHIAPEGRDVPEEQEIFPSDEEAQLAPKDKKSIAQRIYDRRIAYRKKYKKAGVPDEFQDGYKEMFRDWVDETVAQFTGGDLKRHRTADEIQLEFEKWAAAVSERGYDPNDPQVMQQFNAPKRVLDDRSGIPVSEDPFRRIPNHTKKRAEDLAKATGRRQFIYVDLRKMDDLIAEGLGPDDPEFWDNDRLYIISDKLEFYEHFPNDDGLHGDGSKRLNVGDSMILLRGFVSPNGNNGTKPVQSIPSLKFLIYQNTGLKPGTYQDDIDEMTDGDLYESLRHLQRHNMFLDSSKGRHLGEEEQKLNDEINAFLRDRVMGKRLEDRPEGLVSDTREVAGARGARRGGSIDAKKAGAADKPKPPPREVEQIERSAINTVLADRKDISPGEILAWYDSLTRLKRERYAEDSRKGRKRNVGIPSDRYADNDVWDTASASDLRVDTKGPSGVTYADTLHRTKDGKWIARERIHNGVGSGKWDIFEKTSGSRYKRVNTDPLDAQDIHKEVREKAMDKEIDDIFELAIRAFRKMNADLDPVQVEDEIRELEQRREMFKRRLNEALRQRNQAVQKYSFVGTGKPKEEWTPIGTKGGPDPSLSEILDEVSKEVAADGPEDILPDKVEQDTDPFDGWFSRRKTEKIDPFDGWVARTEADDAPTEEIVDDDAPTQEIVPDIDDDMRDVADNIQGWQEIIDKDVPEEPEEPKDTRNYIYRAGKAAGGHSYHIREQTDGDTTKILVWKTGIQTNMGEGEELVHVVEYKNEGNMRQRIRARDKAMGEARDHAKIDAGELEKPRERRGPTPPEKEVRAQTRRERENPRVRSRAEREDNAAEAEEDARVIAEANMADEMDRIAEMVLDEILGGDDDETPGKDDQGRLMSPSPDVDLSRSSSYNKVDSPDWPEADVILEDDLGRYEREFHGDKARLYYRDRDNRRYMLGEYDNDGSSSSEMLERARGHQAAREGVGDWIEEGEEDLYFRDLDGSEYKIYVEDDMIALTHLDVDGNETVVGEKKVPKPKKPSDLVDRKRKIKEEMRELAAVDAFMRRVDNLDYDEKDVSEDRWHSSPLGRGDLISTDGDGGYYYLMRVGSHMTDNRDARHTYQMFRRDKDGGVSMIEGRLLYTDGLNRYARDEWLRYAWSKRTADMPERRGPNFKGKNTRERAVALHERKEHAMEAIKGDFDKFAEVLEDEDGVWTIFTDARTGEVDIVAPDGRRTNLDLTDLEKRDVPIVSRWNSRDGWEDHDMGNILEEVGREREVVALDEVAQGIRERRAKEQPVEIVGDIDDFFAPGMARRASQLEELDNERAWDAIREAMGEVEDVTDPHATPRYVWFDRTLDPNTGKARGWRITRTRENGPQAIQAGVVQPFDYEQGHRVSIERGIPGNRPLGKDKPGDIPSKQVRVTGEGLDSHVGLRSIHFDMLHNRGDKTPEEIADIEREIDDFNERARELRATKQERDAAVVSNADERARLARDNRVLTPEEELEQDRGLVGEADSDLAAKLDELDGDSVMVHHVFDDNTAVAIFRVVGTDGDGNRKDYWTALFQHKDSGKRYNYRFAEKPTAERLQVYKAMQKGEAMDKVISPHLNPDNPQPLPRPNVTEADAPSGAGKRIVFDADLVDDRIIEAMQANETAIADFLASRGHDPTNARRHSAVSIVRSGHSRGSLVIDLSDGTYATPRMVAELREFVARTNPDFVYSEKLGRFTLRPDHPSTQHLRHRGKIMRDHMLADMGVDPNDTNFVDEFDWVDMTFGDLFLSYGIAEEIDYDHPFQTGPRYGGNHNNFRGMIMQPPPKDGVSSPPTIMMAIQNHEWDLASVPDGPDDVDNNIANILIHEIGHSISLTKLEDGSRAQRHELGLEEGLVEHLTAIYAPEIRKAFGFDVPDPDGMLKRMMNMEEGQGIVEARDGVPVSAYQPYIARYEALREALDMDRKSFYGELVKHPMANRGLRELVEEGLLVGESPRAEAIRSMFDMRFRHLSDADKAKMRLQINMLLKGMDVSTFNNRLDFAILAARDDIPEGRHRGQWRNAQDLRRHYELFIGDLNDTYGTDFDIKDFVQMDGSMKPQNVARSQLMVMLMLNEGDSGLDTRERRERARELLQLYEDAEFGLNPNLPF